MSNHENKLIVRMSNELKKQVKIAAAVSDASMEELCRACVIEALAKGESHINSILKKQEA